MTGARVPREQYATRKAQLIERDGKRCRHCGTPRNLTIDHILPRARGGSGDLSNLQLLCRHCNERKGCALEDPAWSLDALRTDRKVRAYLERRND